MTVEVLGLPALRHLPAPRGPGRAAGSQRPHRGHHGAGLLDHHQAALRPGADWAKLRRDFEEATAEVERLYARWEALEKLKAGG
jgi:hypothetical protein